MKVPIKGAVDCDLHPAQPSVPDLLPYLDEYWRDQMVDRHIAKYTFNLTSYPPNSPLSARPDWRQKSGRQVRSCHQHTVSAFAQVERSSKWERNSTSGPEWQAAGNFR